MSISSTLKTISLADKMSVPQLQQAVKDGTIPAYIAVPLIQERMKDKQEAQAAAAGAQPQQPPVADQVMAQADQQEAVASLPTGMPQQYAGGGIVAFADGDLVEDDEALADYNDAIEEAEFDAYAKSLAGRAGATPINKTPATGLGYGDVQGQPMRADKQTYPAEGGLTSLISSSAQKHGVPTALARNIAMAESGGTMNQAGDPRSTAKGPFGMIGSTWRSLGGTEEGRADPAMNADLGTKLIRQNAESLKKSLGRNPTYGEVYAAHHFGPGVSKMLRGAGRDESIEAGLSTFESPSRVKQIMAANPHLRGKSVGQVMAMLDKKGGEGVFEMANGGIAGIPNSAMQSMNMAGGGIARFAKGDMVDIGGKQYEETDDPNYVMANGVRTSRSAVEQSAQSPWNTNKGVAYPSITDGLGTDLKTGAIKTAAATADVIRSPLWAIDRAFGNPIMDKSATPFYDKYVRQAGLDPEPAPVTPTAVKPETMTAAQADAQKQSEKKYPDESRFAKTIPEHFAGKDTGKGTADTTTTTTTPPAAPENPFDKIISQMEQDRQSRGKAADQDRWMGLLTAGLGMMGGTSQNAMQNIGQGAMYGAQQYQQARKATAAEQAAADKAYVNALRYKDIGEGYREKLSQTEAQKKADQDQKEYIAANTVMKDMYNNRVDQAKALYGKPEMWDAETQKKAMDFINEVKKDPRYIDAERRSGSLQGYTVVGQRPAA